MITGCLGDPPREGKSRGTIQDDSAAKLCVLITRECGEGPDISLYPFDRKEEAQDAESSLAEEQGKLLGRTLWEHISVLIKVQTDDAAFALQDPERLPGQSDAEYAVAAQEALLAGNANAHFTHGQMAEYAADIMLRQHRLFLYSVYVYRHTARILRWDRTGVMISEAIDYFHEPEKLCDFFYRLGRMSEAQLGYDTSVTRVLDTKVHDTIQEYHTRRMKEHIYKTYYAENVYKTFLKPGRQLSTVTMPTRPRSIPQASPVDTPSHAPGPSSSNVPPLSSPTLSPSDLPRGLPFS